jgi:hypothetical protein
VNFDCKFIIVTGSTTSTGKWLVHGALSGEFGAPRAVVVCSRGEGKQREARLAFRSRARTSDA